MTVLQRLKLQSKQAAEKKGHSLSRFQSISDSVWEARCICGLGARIDTNRPFYIGGGATLSGCPMKEKNALSKEE